MSATFAAIRCAIHVHSNCSDGELPVERVIEEAQAAEVDALLLTDHDDVFAKNHVPGGYQDKLLLVIGMECDTRTHDHLLVFGLGERVNTKMHLPADAIRLLKTLGATVFVAHPQGRPHLYVFARRHIFTPWGCPDYDGIEAWSYLHDWIERLRPWRLPGMAAHPHRHITGPDPDVMRQWDWAARERRVAGLAGLDTHGDHYHGMLKRLLPGSRNGILSYRENFRAFAHYLLAPPLHGEARHDTAILLAALREGRGWMCHDALASGRAFSFTATGADFEVPVGSEIPYHPGIVLQVAVPDAADIRLLNRGAVVAHTHGQALTHPVHEAGEYRVEVDLDGQAWIRSNHLYIRPGNNGSSSPDAL